MLAVLQDLNPAERELVTRAPLLVFTLIAGADGKIDNHERSRLSLFVFRKATKWGDPIGTFYQDLTNNLNLNLVEISHSYPKAIEERNRKLVQDLGRLNQVWPKLDRHFADKFYQSLKEVAQKTAKASGGYLGIKAISRYERRFVLLPMIMDPELLYPEKTPEKES